MAGIIQKGARRFTTQIGAAGVPDAVTTTIPLVSVTGLPTDTPIELVIDRTDASGNLTPSKEEVVRGTVSGTNLINCVRGVEGTAQAHSAGATVNSFLTASMWNNIIEYTRDLPTRGLINGLIVPTVASNNLTVAIKTLQNTDPSPANPVYVWIDNTLRTITSSLSVTANAGTNWLNMGSAELATREVDLFIFMQWNSTTSAVNILVSRLPYPRLMGDFTNSGTTEKGVFGIVNYNATDDVVNIGRFAATLSAGAGYTWTVPTFTNANLIQEPIYETRWLDWLPTVSATGGMGYTLNLSAYKAKYQVNTNTLSIDIFNDSTTTGAGSFGLQATLPFTITSSSATNTRLAGAGNDGGGIIAQVILIDRNNILQFRRYDSANYGIGSSRVIGCNSIIYLQ